MADPSQTPPPQGHHFSNQLRRARCIATIDRILSFLLIVGISIVVVCVAWRREAIVIEIRASITTDHPSPNVHPIRLDTTAVQATFGSPGGALSFLAMYLFTPAAGLILATIIALRDRATQRRLAEIEDRQQLLAIFDTLSSQDRAAGLKQLADAIVDAQRSE